MARHGEFIRIGTVSLEHCARLACKSATFIPRIALVLRQEPADQGNEAADHRDLQIMRACMHLFLCRQTPTSHGKLSVDFVVREGVVGGGTGGRAQDARALLAVRDGTVKLVLWIFQTSE